MLLLFITGCKRKYKVEFLNSDGTIIETQKVLKGDKIQCSSEPLKEGYIFINKLIVCFKSHIDPAFSKDHCGNSIQYGAFTQH